MIKLFKSLTKFEFGLWLCSVIVVGVSYFLSPTGDLLSLVASLIGVTSLIFCAKGYVIGQVLIVIFAVIYGIISFQLRYYGEMITYLGMSAPIAIFSVVSWLRHPFKKSAEVEVGRLQKKQMVLISVLTVIVTVLFYFILKALGNANLLFSTISVTTSFLASYFAYLRSEYFALAYAGNDMVLIILWVMAADKDISYLPMVMCFVMFLINDIYGFINWQRMKKRQRKFQSNS